MKLIDRDVTEVWVRWPWWSESESSGLKRRSRRRGVCIMVIIGVENKAGIGRYRQRGKGKSGEF